MLGPLHSLVRQAPAARGLPGLLMETAMHRPTEQSFRSAESMGSPVRTVNQSWNDHVRRWRLGQSGHPLTSAWVATRPGSAANAYARCYARDPHTRRVRSPCRRAWTPRWHHRAGCRSVRSVNGDRSNQLYRVNVARGSPTSGDAGSRPRIGRRRVPPSAGAAIRHVPVPSLCPRRVARRLGARRPSILRT